MRQTAAQRRTLAEHDPSSEYFRADRVPAGADRVEAHVSPPLRNIPRPHVWTIADVRASQAAFDHNADVARHNAQKDG